MRRPSVASILLAASASLMAASAPLLAAEAPAGRTLAGHWVANIARSKRHPNHQFQSATLHVVIAGDAVTIHHGGVNAAGEPESGTVVLQADGKEHPVPGHPEVTMTTRWVGDRRLETTGTSAGKKVGGQVYEVSADGNTLTATVDSVDASGRPFDQVIVFDRK